MSGIEPDSFTTFGELLKYLRQRARMTQRQLGVAVCYSDAQITRLESGQRLPDATAVKARFIEALSMQDEPALAQRLIELAEQAQATGARQAPSQSNDQPNGTPATTAVSTNLPLQLTRFIGRQQDIVEVQHLLVSNRLVTLTGAGGVGKTRLAIEVGVSFAGVSPAATTAFPDGVWLVEFAPLADPALLPQVVAAVFTLAEQPGHPRLDGLTTFLRDKHLLLILDNCEHLIQACAELAEALLRASPHLQVLATSREALRIPGEIAWRVPSLSTPDPADVPPLERALDYGAVELFVEHARAARAGFALGPDTVAAVSHICARLDGIPLAIEMAAAQVSALSAGEIAAALDNMFTLLRSGQRTALPRQQTLRAALDWSFALLNEPERVLLARLSVFAGGWTADAVKTVCEPDALPLLLGLVLKSLVVASPGDGVTRYRLLEPVRQYAADKLRERGGGEITATRERHWAYYLAMGEAENAEDGHELNAWTRRLDAELDNLRAAFEYARTRALDDRGEHLLRLARAVTTYLWSCGHSDEGRLWLDEALERGAAGPLPVRARALEARATLARVEGDWRQSLHFVEASLALFRETDDPFATAWALHQRGELALYMEDDPQAGLGYAEQALEQFRRAASSFGIASALGFIGYCLQLLGEPDRAKPPLEEAYQIFERTRSFQQAAGVLRALARVDEQETARLWTQAIGRLRDAADREGLVEMLRAWGLTRMDAGDNAQAIPLLSECLDLLQSEGVGPEYRMIRAEVEMDLGLAEYRSGRVDAAVAHHEAALRVTGRNGLRAASLARYHYYLAFYALTRGDRASAERHSREGFRYSRDSGNGVVLALQLAQQSELASLRGGVARAARLAAAAAMHEGRIHYGIEWPAPWVEYQQALANVRAQVHDAGLETAWAEGERMTLDQAVAYALQDDEVDGPPTQ